MSDSENGVLVIPDERWWVITEESDTRKRIQEAGPWEYWYALEYAKKKNYMNGSGHISFLEERYEIRT